MDVFCKRVVVLNKNTKIQEYVKKGMLGDRFDEKTYLLDLYGKLF